MENDGTINNQVSIIGGMKAIDARMKIISELEKEGYLVKSEKIDEKSP